MAEIAQGITKEDAVQMLRADLDSMEELLLAGDIYGLMWAQDKFENRLANKRILKALGYKIEAGPSGEFLDRRLVKIEVPIAEVSDNG